MDVVPPTFHLRATHETIWIVRVREVGGQEGAWKYLEGRRRRGNQVVVLLMAIPTMNFNKPPPSYYIHSLGNTVFTLNNIPPPPDLCEGEEGKVTEGKDV